MGKNLRNRIVFIVAVLALSVYGIIGIPHGGLKQALTDRIHLGLDLRGGTHLVLQVKVAEAVSHETDKDRAAAGGRPGEGRGHGRGGDQERPGAPGDDSRFGRSGGQLGDVRGVLSANYSNYDLGSMPDGSLSLTLKPEAVRDIETRALDSRLRRFATVSTSWAWPSR